MCTIDTSKDHSAKLPFFLYKLVTKDRKSLWAPDQREGMNQVLRDGTRRPYGSTGVILDYSKGKTVFSSSGPGIMGFTSPKGAENLLHELISNQSSIYYDPVSNALLLFFGVRVACFFGQIKVITLRVPVAATYFEGKHGSYQVIASDEVEVIT